MVERIVPNHLLDIYDLNHINIDASLNNQRLVQTNNFL